MPLGAVVKYGVMAEHWRRPHDCASALALAAECPVRSSLFALAQYSEPSGNSTISEISPMPITKMDTRTSTSVKPDRGFLSTVISQSPGLSVLREAEGVLVVAVGILRPVDRMAG